MRHECDLVPHRRHPVVPQRHALLRIGNLNPWAGTPVARAEQAAESAKLGFGMELPDREFGLWREFAAAIPCFDAQPSCPKHLRMRNEIAGIHVLERRYGIVARGARWSTTGRCRAKNDEPRRQ